MSVVELDRLACHWEWALDAAQRAVDAARVLTDPIHREADAQVRGERDAVQALLSGVAGERPGAPRPWLPPFPVSAHLLGLPASIRACVFDLDGVLTDSGALHAAAWRHVLDDLLLGIDTPESGRHFDPFDPVDDYRIYLDGRPRLEGIHAFLASRGIRLPEGRPGDAPGSATAWALANHKGAVLERSLAHRGVNALPGARRYLAAAGHARLARAVVSASTTTLPMLELAQLGSLVDVRVDADSIREQGLRPRPHPDLLLAACAHAGVAPSDAVTLTHSPAGVAAGRAAGLAVIAVGDRLLEVFGAERVVPQLASLLDPRLLAS